MVTFVTQRIACLGNGSQFNLAQTPLFRELIYY